MPTFWLKNSLHNFPIPTTVHIEKVKNKIRSEIRNSLKKDKILNEEDKVLIYKFYIKIKKEFDDIKTE